MIDGQEFTQIQTFGSGENLNADDFIVDPHI